MERTYSDALLSDLKKKYHNQQYKLSQGIATFKMELIFLSWIMNLFKDSPKQNEQAAEINLRKIHGESP